MSFNEIESTEVILIAFLISNGLLSSISLIVLFSIKLSMAAVKDDVPNTSCKSTERNLSFHNVTISGSGSFFESSNLK